MNNLTAKEIAALNKITAYRRDLALGTTLQAMINGINSGITDAVPAGTPVNALNATKALTIDGVVVHGETVVIGSDVYEFSADVAQTVTDEGNIPVNIEAGTTHSTLNLTIASQPISGPVADTMTIGGKVFTFVPVGTATADGEISVGTDLASAKLAIVAAINGTDGVNQPHPDVRAAAFAANVCALTALIGGVSGDLIDTTSAFDNVGNLFAGVTLAGGADCSKGDARTALVAAITASDTQGVGAAAGAGDTMLLTADVAGVIGNAIVIGETMAHGAFAAGAVALSGGLNGTVGVIHQQFIDATYLYRAIANNSISGKNWRRISLGAAY